ncbi:hypothetical protein ACFE04_007692 [Oxalis oulophora]
MSNSSGIVIRRAGAVPAAVLIPMRFVWRYGGTHVSLSGSFNGWTQLLPMSRVEGLPSVVQVITSLPPGFHQYKFCVDGEWKHDEHQPHTTIPVLGIVNTVLLAMQPNNTDGLNLNPNNPTRATNMDEDGDDNQASQQMVRIPGRTLTYTNPRTSESDLQVSRRRVSEFLSSKTAYELLPHSSKVVALDVDLPVKQALHILHKEGVYVAPLCDSRIGQFVGVLSASDFILMLKELGNRGSNLTEEQLDTHTIAAWKEGKAYLNNRINGHGRALLRPLIHAGPHDNLKDIALKILQNNIATVPIIHSSPEDSFPELLHVTSLSGILRLMQQPICEISVGTWGPKIGESNRRPLAMLTPNASLGSALNLLLQAQVSSLPIVDANDSLLELYCRSDITALAKVNAYAHINLNAISIQQALQLGHDSFSSFEQRSQRCQMCLRTDSLHSVMERLAKPGVRRIVVVEAGSKRVEGIVSLGDIFRFFLLV